MLRTPLKNSKNVNKPFKSPFESSNQNKEKSTSANTTLKQNCETSLNSPLSTRSLEAKRILLLDEDEKEKKRSKVTEDDNSTHETLVPQELTKTDLLVLKRKIFEMRQELDSLKSRDNCAKKHDPKDLRISINKWKTVCQDTLEILCSELKKRGEENSNISDILNNLGIPETIVNYSKKDDGFI